MMWNDVKEKGEVERESNKARKKAFEKKEVVFYF
jgi:hypothetical protein